MTQSPHQQQQPTNQQQQPTNQQQQQQQQAAQVVFGGGNFRILQSNTITGEFDVVGDKEWVVGVPQHRRILCGTRNWRFAFWSDE